MEKEKNNEITLRFIELRKVEDVEWALLNKNIGGVSSSVKIHLQQI